MTRDDIHKLIAGYATGTLSEAERQALFAAALDDQELFDQLAREQELKELLDEPGIRQRLITSLEPPPRASGFDAWRGRWSWMAAAATVAAIVLGVYLSQPSEPKRLAVNLPPPPPISPAPFVPAPPENAPAPPLPAPSAVERSRRSAAPALPPPAAPAVEGRLAEPKLADQKSAEQPAPAPKEEALKVAPAPAPKADIAPPPAPKQAPAAIAQTGVAPSQQAGQSPIASLLDTGAAAGGGGGGRGGRGGAAFGGLAQNKVAAKAVAPAFSFAYSVTADGGLRIVPSQNGFLSVSAGDQLLASNRALVAASTTEIPLPDGATSATIVFSAQQITDSITAIVATPLDASSGTISDPRPTPASRLEVVIALPPRQ